MPFGISRDSIEAHGPPMGGEILEAFDDPLADGEGMCPLIIARAGELVERPRRSGIRVELDEGLSEKALGARSDEVLDALELALHEGSPFHDAGQEIVALGDFDATAVEGRRPGFHFEEALIGASGAVFGLADAARLEQTVENIGIDGDPHPFAVCLPGIADGAFDEICLIGARRRGGLLGQRLAHPFEARALPIFGVFTGHSTRPGQRGKCFPG